MVFDYQGWGEEANVSFVRKTKIKQKSESELRKQSTTLEWMKLKSESDPRDLKIWNKIARWDSMRREEET